MIAPSTYPDVREATGTTRATIGRDHSTLRGCCLGRTALKEVAILARCTCSALSGGFSSGFALGAIEERRSSKYLSHASGEIEEVASITPLSDQNRTITSS